MSGAEDSGSTGAETDGDGDTDTGGLATAPPDMVEIPAGSFTMGSPVGELGRVGPGQGSSAFDPADEVELQHEVTISRTFWIGRTEVTQRQYEAVVGTNPADNSGCGPDCPVENVTWLDAVAYLNARSEAEGLDPCYMVAGDEVSWDPSCTGYRLPTESEWEYAARAGTTTAFHNGDITSDDCDDAGLAMVGHYCRAADRTAPVAQLEPNALGLYDMHGNVGEWAWDWVGVYPAGPVTDPTGAPTGAFRVDRGGSWLNTNAGNCRSAYRDDNHMPSERFAFIGFRAARTVP